MALFQNAVLNKYLSGVDEKKVEEAWGKFTAHFHDAEVQENIRNSKEEAYQEGFLDDLFVKVLGYTKNPSPDYNLMVEQKNITDSKKSDGALLDGDKVRGVIELKGTETTDLGKVETQAFGYKNKQPDAIYVIISNFEKLRFYIDNAVDFLEFNLFRLTKEEFKVLWLCLGYPNFAKGLPKKIKDASLTEEENITKELYKDYSDFKHAVFESMKEHNPEYDKLLLFKKTQKLLDRFLFIFFAEDRLLLPPNSIREIIRQWMDLRDKYDEYVPLYDRFKKYFGYMNEGHKGKNHEIFAYNGGLFAEDEVLDNLKIEDEILYKYASELSKYDFESEVDVNILGHIFEHSLNEIEEINAELKGEKVDSSKTRRKKDGVFYTPKYITKYIVEHTVGKLCEEKKAELDIVDERFTEAGRRSQKGVSDLKTYREWLLGLTICDPACGSGAFLNQALEFLIAEHKYIDELQAKYHGESLVLSDIEDQILENNLYGVDINEESVEIAKLSLWLRTAQKGRKLTSLNSHIKCGNSLIDDPEVAGDKAFKWQEEFPDIFRQKDKQAFHVTFVTHNSRTSGRMKDYKVKKGESFRLDDELEVFVTKTIAEIVKEDDLNVLAYNICADHVHMILVCEPEELPNIVRKLKGKSAQKLKEHLEIPKEEKFHLWAQKFNRKLIEDEDALYNSWNYIIHNRAKHDLPENKKLQEHDKGLPSTSKELDTGFDKNFDPDFDTGLPDTAPTTDKGLLDTGKGIPETGKGLQPLVSSGSAGSNSPERGEFGFFGMCCSLEYAFRPEYCGGFDVVIGNPPYVNINTLSEEELKYLGDKFSEIHTGYNDLMYYFLFKGINLVKTKGSFGMITSNYFIGNEYAKKLRSFLSQYISSILNFVDYQIFKDANVHTALIFANKFKESDLVKYYELPSSTQTITDLQHRDFNEVSVNRNELNDYWIFTGEEKSNLLNKIESNSILLGSITEIEKGSTTGRNSVFTIPKEVAVSYNIEKDMLRKNVKNGDIDKYYIFDRGDYLIYTDGDTEIENYPNTLNYLRENKDSLSKRNEVKKGRYPWWRLERPRRKEFFDSEEKIIVPYRATENRFAYDNEQRFNDGGDVRLIVITDTNFSIKYVLGLLNSRLLNWYYGFIGKPKGNSREYFNEPLAKIPIAKPQKDFEEKIIKAVERVIKLKSEREDIRTSFSELLQSKFDIEKLSRKLQSWHELTFKQFLKELKKKKVKLSLEEESEWMEYFKEQKAEAEELKTQIAQTDAEIDAMVYELYGLSEEEIEVVEGSVG